MSWRHVHVLRPLLVGLLHLAMLVLGRIRVRGRDRVPREGGILILSNHRSDCDPVAVQVACPRPIRFMAKSELFDMGLLGWALRWGHAFPVKRGEPDRNALRLAADLLKQGEAVCVFPEGQLTETGRLQPLKPGIALIVRMAGVPVICCGLRNTERIIPYGSLIPRISSRQVEVMWGEVRQFDKETSPDDIVAWAEGQFRELTGEDAG